MFIEKGGTVMKQLFINLYSMINTVVFLLIRMVSSGLKISSMEKSTLSDKPWFIQIKNRISVCENKNLKSCVSDISNQTGRSNISVNGNHLKYNSTGSHCFRQDPICLNERKMQNDWKEPSFLIPGIIPDG
jgi:hypothetical protein